MTLKLIYLLAVFFLSNNVFGQFYPKYEEYRHFSVFKKKDTINYHIYSKNDIKTTDGIIMFIQGSAAEPLFKITKKNKYTSIKSQVPFTWTRFLKIMLLWWFLKNVFLFLQKTKTIKRLPVFMQTKDWITAPGSITKC